MNHDQPEPGTEIVQPGASLAAQEGIAMTKTKQPTAAEPDVGPPTPRCVCKQACEQALEWAARAPLAQCCPDDQKCTCWCHDMAAEQDANKARRSIWRAK